MVNWHCCFEPVARQHIVVSIHGGGKLLTSWELGSKERERRGQGLNMLFKGAPPMT
jgi:hypothetical protein